MGLSTGAMSTPAPVTRDVAAAGVGTLLGLHDEKRPGLGNPLFYGLTPLIRSDLPRVLSGLLSNTFHSVGSWWPPFYLW